MRHSAEIQVLSSNKVVLPVHEETVGQLEPFSYTDPWSFRQDARDSFWENGYLFLKGLLPPESVNQIRSIYFSLSEQSNPTTISEHGFPGHPAHQLARDNRFDIFTRNSVLVNLSEVILQGSTYLMKRRPIRHYKNGTWLASRAHTDSTYIGLPSSSYISVWIPLGDCPIASGGITYLKGSAQADLDTVRSLVTSRNQTDARPITDDLHCLSESLGSPWLIADYEAGDVVLHSGDIIHASLDTVSEYSRLSTDLRFARKDAGSDSRWEGDWSANDGF